MVGKNYEVGLGAEGHIPALLTTNRSTENLDMIRSLYMSGYNINIFIIYSYLCWYV